MAAERKVKDLGNQVENLVEKSFKADKEISMLKKAKSSFDDEHNIQKEEFEKDYQEKVRIITDKHF